MAASDVYVAEPAEGTGGILVGPLGTTVNTDATTVPDPALTPTGFVGEDGVTMSTARSTERIRAWGGSTVRTVQTEHDVTFTFRFLETNEVTSKAVYHDDNVTATAATTTAGNTLAIKVNSKPLPHKTWQLEMRDGDRRGRIVIPDGQITDTGDVTYVHSNANGVDVTLEAYEDENGNKAYIYWDDGQTTAA